MFLLLLRKITLFALFIFLPYNKNEYTKNNISDIIKKYKLYISEIFPWQEKIILSLH